MWWWWSSGGVVSKKRPRYIIKEDVVVVKFVVVLYTNPYHSIYIRIYYIISKQRAVKIQIHLSSFYYLLATSLQNQVRKGEKTKTN